MNTANEQRMDERAARAALARHITPVEIGAHLPGFDAADAWSRLTSNGSLRHFHPVPALKAAQETARFVIPVTRTGQTDFTISAPLARWACG